MDLFRVVTATGDVTKPVALDSTKEFITHAINGFDKFENTKHDKTIKKELVKLYNTTALLNDTAHRLKWSERALTSGCRLF